MSLADHKNPNGTYNGVTALAELTGLPADEIVAIGERIHLNAEKLASCAHHEFKPIPKDQGLLGRQYAYRCINCGGEVDHKSYRWHELGRRPKPTTPETAKD